MSVAAALAHLVCIIGGPRWYLFMGAPPQLVEAAARGDAKLGIMTAVIAIIVFGWAAYAFSAAGLIRLLPLTKLALIAISLVLFARGTSYFLAPLWHGWRPDLSPTFLVWSSLICLIMGLCFMIGTWQAWPNLRREKPNTLT